jgi:hypothetical protein
MSTAVVPQPMVADSAHGMAGRGSGRGKRPSPQSPGSAAAPAPTRAQRDRGPNWSTPEVLALVAAKRELYLEELDIPDGWELMRRDSAIWKRISAAVMRAGHSPCPRDAQSCKTKWHQIFPDKRLADHHTISGVNSLEFWDMASHERTACSLPKSFPLELYESLHEWNGDRPAIIPPHMRDMLAPTDTNYRPSRREEEGVSDEEDVQENKPFCEDLPLCAD